MKTWYVTFGVQYGQYEHPMLPGVTADHWLRIVAPTEQLARSLTVAVVGDCWASIYDEANFQPEWHPAGEFASVEFRFLAEVEGGEK